MFNYQLLRLFKKINNNSFINSTEWWNIRIVPRHSQSRGNFKITFIIQNAKHVCKAFILFFSKKQGKNLTNFDNREQQTSQWDTT